MTPAPVLRMLRAVLRWVHISDLHFEHGKAGAWADREIVLEQLIQDATELKNSLGAPHALFVTGDIAFSGKQKEYDDAEAWLGKLLKALDLKPEQVFLVPGNHDNDRGVVKVSLDLHQKIRAGESVDDHLVGDTPPLLAKQGAYAQFAARYRSSEKWYARTLDNSLGPVTVVGLNSAVASFNNEDSEQNLTLGRLQHKFILDQPKDHLLLVLQHHPVEWLADGTQEAALIAQRPHLWFSGHVHKPGGGVLISLFEPECFRLVAGAAHSVEGSQEPFSYAWGQLSCQGLEYYPRLWDAKRQCFGPASQLPRKIGLSKLHDALEAWLRRPDPVVLGTRRKQLTQKISRLLAKHARVLAHCQGKLGCADSHSVADKLLELTAVEFAKLLGLAPHRDGARDDIAEVLELALPLAIDVKRDFLTQSEARIVCAQVSCLPLAELVMAADEERPMVLCVVPNGLAGRDSVYDVLELGTDINGDEWFENTLRALERKLNLPRKNLAARMRGLRADFRELAADGRPEEADLIPYVVVPEAEDGSWHEAQVLKLLNLLPGLRVIRLQGVGGHEQRNEDIRRHMERLKLPKQQP